MLSGNQKKDSKSNRRPQKKALFVRVHLAASIQGHKAFQPLLARILQSYYNSASLSGLLTGQSKDRMGGGFWCVEVGAGVESFGSSVLNQ